MMTSRHLLATLLTSSALVLTGCGGGGGGSSTPSFSGSTAPATIDADNSEAIGVSAGEAAVEAVNTDKANSANPFGVEISSQNDIVIQAAIELGNSVGGSNALADLPVAVTISYTDLGPGFCGGSVSVPDNFGQGTNGDLNGALTLSNLCYNDGFSGQITLSGQIIFAQNASSSSISFVNLTATTSEGSSTLNSSITCSSNFLSCTYSSDFVGADGGTHRVSDFTVSGDAASGYTVSATFFHSTHGQVSVTTTSAFQYGGSCFPQPDSGSLSYSSTNGSSGSITFNRDCSVSGTWYDGLASGSF